MFLSLRCQREKLRWFEDTLKDMLRSVSEDYGLVGLHLMFYHLHDTALDPLATELHFPSTVKLLESVEGVKVLQKEDGGLYVHFDDPTPFREVRPSPGLSPSSSVTPPQQRIQADSEVFTRNSQPQPIYILSQNALSHVDMVLIRKASVVQFERLGSMIRGYTDFLRGRPGPKPGRIAIGDCLMHKHQRDGLQRCVVTRTGTMGPNRYYMLCGLDNGRNYEVEGDETLSAIPDQLADFPAFAIHACMRIGDDTPLLRRMRDIIQELIATKVVCGGEFLKVVTEGWGGHCRMHEIRLHVQRDSPRATVYPDAIMRPPGY